MESTTRAMPEKVRLRIRMERPFGKFGPAERARFLDGLAFFTCCAPEDFSEVTFRRGCVMFEASLPSAAVEQLRDLLALKDAANRTDQAEALARFLREQSVEDVSDGHGGRTQVRTTLHIRTRQGKTTGILFVHGWRSDNKAFGNVPALLEQRTAAKATIYQYPTSLLAHSPALRHIARNLDNFVRMKCDVDRLAIVAHRGSLRGR